MDRVHRKNLLTTSLPPTATTAKITTATVQPDGTKKKQETQPQQPQVLASVCGNLNPKMTSVIGTQQQVLMALQESEILFH